jgi:hypothetical protein
VRFFFGKRLGLADFVARLAFRVPFTADFAFTVRTLRLESAFDTVAAFSARVGVLTPFLIVNLCQRSFSLLSPDTLLLKWAPRFFGTWGATGLGATGT